MCEGGRAEGPALHWEPGSRFHASNHSSGRHFTWFPRKNYNKSSRGGAQGHREKEKRARVKQHVLICLSALNPHHSCSSNSWLEKLQLVCLGYWSSVSGGSEKTQWTRCQQDGGEGGEGK